MNHETTTDTVKFDYEAFKKIIEEQNKNKPEYNFHWEFIIPRQDVCPSCGHCPHCGRGGYGTRPYYEPYIVWTSTNRTGDLIR